MQREQIDLEGTMKVGEELTRGALEGRVLADNMQIIHNISDY